MHLDDKFGNKSTAMKGATVRSACVKRVPYLSVSLSYVERHKGSHLGGQLSLSFRENANSGFCMLSHSPCIQVYKAKACIHSFRFLPIYLCVVEGCSWLVLRHNTAGFPAAAISLRLKEQFRLKEQIMDNLHLFQDAVSTVSLWMRSFPALG